MTSPVLFEFLLSVAPRSQQIPPAMRRFLSSAVKDPFRVLGLKEPCSYESVKKAFAQLALKHHPDMQDGSAERFTQIRQAFESIQGLDNGTALLAHEKEFWTEEDLSQVVREETGHDLRFHMTAAQRRAMAQVANTMAPGGLDKGGMWELAATIAREEKDRPSQDEPKQVGSGVRTTTSQRRRRRKQ